MASPDHNDLRSDATGTRRERDRQHKWCHNFSNRQRPTPEMRPATASDRRVRPFAREHAAK